jgi:hypothetical protein
MKLTRMMVWLLLLPVLPLAAQAPVQQAPVDDIARCQEMAKFAGQAIAGKFHTATAEKSKAVIQNPPVTSCYVQVQIDIRH